MITHVLRWIEPNVSPVSKEKISIVNEGKKKGGGLQNIIITFVTRLKSTVLRHRHIDYLFLDINNE